LRENAVRACNEPQKTFTNCQLGVEYVSRSCSRRQFYARKHRPFVPRQAGAMAKKKDATYDRLIKVGLQDPFIRGIAGVVVIATAASIAISTLGSGTKAIITIALSLLFGVVLVILRALMKYADSTFVRMVCFASSAVIVTVFLVFTVLLVPAAVICWPQPYAQLLNLPNCLASIEQATIEKPFTPVEYTGTGITHNADND